MPTQARGSMRALEYAERGLTAKARHPSRRMLMMRGFSPDVYRVRHGVVPKGNWCGAGGERGTGKFHDGSDGEFDNAVELVDVWRTGGVVHSAVSENLGEFGG
eukprot:2457347-Pleurochrysis_carterae.AAC.1